MRHRLSIGCVLLSLSLTGAAAAQVPGTVKIGVLSDFSGPFADQTGKGSLIAAQMAAEDFATEAKGFTVEILPADHQNEPDLGAAIVRWWVDQNGVHAIVDLPNPPQPTVRAQGGLWRVERRDRIEAPGPP